MLLTTGGTSAAASQQNSPPNIVLIFVDDNVVEAIKAGVTNYVVKPVKGDVIWEKIGKYFTG